MALSKPCKSTKSTNMSILKENSVLICSQDKIARISPAEILIDIKSHSKPKIKYIFFAAEPDQVCPRCGQTMNYLW